MLCFLMAPRHHSAMRHVGPIRAELGTRTIFNLLGPLSNPALVKRIIVGVYDAAWCRPFTEALDALGTTHAFVVHGKDGLDEVTTTTSTKVASLVNGTITEFEIHPSDFGLKTAHLDDLKGGNGEENAAALCAQFCLARKMLVKLIMMLSYLMPQQPLLAQAMRVILKQLSLEPASLLRAVPH